VTLLYIEKYASYNGFSGLVMSCGDNPVPYHFFGPSAQNEYIAEGPIIAFFSNGRA
jgi:hypothetical protein